MINYKLKVCFDQHYNIYRNTIEEVSKPNETADGLVDSQITIYNFDKIVASLFKPAEKPCSFDGVMFSGKDIYCIEFKSGFKDKISIDKYKDEDTYCDILPGICDKYETACNEKKDYFFIVRDKEKNQLMDSILIKGIEGYVILEKYIFPKCEKDGLKKRLNYIVVVDEDGIELYEDALVSLSGKSSIPKTKNYIIKIRNRIRRLIGKKDDNNVDFYYDRIEVYSVSQFKKFLTAKCPD